MSATPAGRPPTRPALPAPVTFRVRCQGKLHRISWRPGKDGLVIHDHRRTELSFQMALEVPCPCAGIYHAVRQKDFHNDRLPLALRRALREYVDGRLALGHGQDIRAELPVRLRGATVTAWLTRRMQGLFGALTRQGLVLNASIDVYSHPRRTTVPLDITRYLRIVNRSHLE
jgi:hypothetical protein